MALRLLSLMISFALSAYPQAFDIASFQQSLNKAKNDSNKVNTLNTVSSYLIKIKDYKHALQFSDSAILLSKKLDFTKGEVEACENFSYIHYTAKNYSKAIIYDKRKLDLYIRQNSKTDVANSLTAIGTLFFHLHNLDSAIYYYKESLSIYTQIKAKIETATVTAGLGEFHFQAGDYNQALEYSLNGLGLFEKLKDQQSAIGCCLNIIDAYKNKGDLLKTSEFEKKLSDLQKTK